MTSKTKGNNEGAAMRRLALLATVSAFIVLALVSVAYANTSSFYVTWTSKGVNAGSLPTPHKDFQLTTSKCEVCHAVHKATMGGEVLLRSSISNACLYCHVETLVGNIQIYGGQDSNYTNAYATNHSGSGGVSDCVDCHAVHGAATMTGTVSAKILKYGGFETTLTLLGGASYDATTGTHDGQVTTFCTKCHPYYTRAYSTQPNSDINIPIGGANGVGVTDAGTYSSHVMTDAHAAYTAPNTNYGGKVAWEGSNYCRSCHDAGLTDESSINPGTISFNNFPHYTQNYSRFLTGALFFTSPTSTIGSGQDSASADGVCLKCHRNSATTGIGFDF